MLKFSAFGVEFALWLFGVSACKAALAAAFRAEFAPEFKAEFKLEAVQAMADTAKPQTDSALTISFKFSSNQAPMTYKPFILKALKR